MGFPKMGDPNSWMVYNGESNEEWMIWGYPNLPKAPYIYKRVESMIDPEIGWFPMANDQLCGSVYHPHAIALAVHMTWAFPGLPAVAGR